MAPHSVTSGTTVRNSSTIAEPQTAGVFVHGLVPYLLVVVGEFGSTPVANLLIVGWYWYGGALLVLVL